MISIIDTGSKETQSAASLLDRIGIKYLISQNEVKICGGDKLILPASSDINSALKQLHILNLFSLLRMVKKPILGINSGMILMSDFISVNSKPGLGIFPVKSENIIEENNSDFKFGQKEVLFLNKSKLFFNIKNGESFYFENSLALPKNEFSTSVFEFNNKQYSSTIEKDNFYGIQFIPEKSGEAGIQLIKNFIEL